MKFKSSLFAMLLLLISSVAIAHAEGFTFSNTYSTADFVATYPAPDDKSVQFSTNVTKTNNNKDTVTINFYLETLKNDNAAFLILYTNLPFTPESDTAALDRMIDTGFGRISGTVDTRVNGTFGGHSGRFASGGNEKMYEFVAVAIIGNHIWSGIVTCTKGYCSQADADAFFDSVTIK